MWDISFTWILPTFGSLLDDVAVKVLLFLLLFGVCWLVKILWEHCCSLVASTSAVHLGSMSFAFLSFSYTPGTLHTFTGSSPRSFVPLSFKYEYIRFELDSHVMLFIVKVMSTAVQNCL